MALFEYWNEVNPPAGELVAAYIGFKAKRKSKGLTDVEERVMVELGPARPFNCLPIEVQQWVKDNRKSQKRERKE